MTYLPFPPVLETDITKNVSSPTRDAFSRLRVSMPTTLIESKQIYDNLPLDYTDVQMSGGGTSSTYNTNQASTTISVTNLTAGRRVRQTKRRFSYQPGKSHLIDVSFKFGAGATGITKRVGYCSERNGVFVQQVNTIVSLGVRSYVTGSAVDTLVAQSSWNIDRLDGSGGTTNPSGFTLDVTKVQLFTCYFQWLGVGGITFCFNINGMLIPVHHVNNANVITTVFMSNPNLPVRYEIINDGTGPAASMDCICASVISEGGRNLAGIDRSVDRGVTGLVTLNDSNFYPLIAIRIGSTFEGAQIVPRTASVMCTSTSAFLWRIILNPTVVGTALSFSAVSNSYVQANVATTNATTVTGGTVIMSGYSQAATENSVDIVSVPDLSLGFTADGIADILVLAVARLSGTAETFFGALGWHEAI